MGNENLLPTHWEKIYFNWLENIEDWCISRQIMWGHRIPAWYDENKNIYVGSDEQDVRKKYDIDANIKLIQDDDVLDTWFSSSLWPFSTLDWKKDKLFFNKYFPTNLLVTGFDIIFFWVARMIMMSIKFTKDIPFKKIYIHGLVRDSEGKKMSKSVGNVIDPIDVIEGINLDDLLIKRTESLISEKQRVNVEKKTKKDFPNGIKEYGADALRFNFCAMASTGRDINFDLNRIEGYRNFCNKLWNASRYIIISCKDFEYNENVNFTKINIFDKWILYKLDNVVSDFKKYTSSYRFDLMANSIYEFVWNQYCDWYLEIAKNNLDDTTKSILIFSMNRILKLCHPVIPFITESIWSELRKLNFVDKDSLITSDFPSLIRITREDIVIDQVEMLQDIIKKIRKTRTELGIHPKEQIKTTIITKNKILYHENLNQYSNLINNLANISINVCDSIESSDNDYIDLIDEDFIIYLHIKSMININDEVARIGKKLSELKNIQTKIDSKLNNKDFIERAPADIITQNVTNKQKIENEILSLENLMKTLSN